jgi:predicted Zn-dependent peptidase
MNLAYYELMGDANRVNTEIERYRATTTADIQRVAKENLLKEKSSTLVYLCNTNAK